MITKSVTLRCNPERAFFLFTERASEWWPEDRRHTDDAASTIRIEKNGRFFERAGDGTEAVLGAVRVYEPPDRLVIEWYPGTSEADPTEVEVRFEAVDGGTRVTIEHDLGAATPEIFSRNAPIYSRSWDTVLGAFANFDFS